MGLELTVPSLFVAGLAASPHCSLMCGPLQGALAGGGPRRLALLQLGRLAGYSMLGAVAGAAGSQALLWLPQPELGKIAQFAAALALVATGLALLRRPRCGMHTGRPVPRARGSALGRGIAWALLPCAALYAVLFLAAVSGNALDGALLLLAFGAGTLPALAASSWLLRRLSRGGDWRQLAAALIVVLGSASALMVAATQAAAGRCEVSRLN